jgi:putative ABC transport system permease protein
MRYLLTDLRYGARRLRARPAYTFLASLTLALGIGGTAAIFGIAKPLIFDPLPFTNAGKALAFWRDGWWTEEEFLYLRDKFVGFKAVGAQRPRDVILREDGAPPRLVPAMQVTAELFPQVLGAQPALGRNFQKGDDVQGAEPVAIISHGLWQELGGTREVLGRRLTLSDGARTIIGVMPRGFWFPDPRPRLWYTPPLDPQGRNGSWALVGLPVDGKTPQQMNEHLAQLTRTMKERFTYSEKGDKIADAAFRPLREALVGSMRPGLIAMLIGMGLILIIACANVAALMLGQIEGRGGELAVRTALGASRPRLLQQIIIEAVLVGIIAGVAGATFAATGYRMLAGAVPIGAWAETAAFDWTLFGLALLIAIGAMLVVAIVPATSMWKGDLRLALGGARTGGVQGRGGRIERSLVVVEVALAMLIASGAALLVRSVQHLYAIDTGIEVENVLVLDALTAPTINGAARGRQIDETLRAATAIPGVQSIAAGMKLPLRGEGNSFGVTIPGRESAQGTGSYFRMVTDDYFATLGIRLINGRLFNSGDMPTPELSIVVNEAFVKKFFPNDNPIGRVVGGGFGNPQRIVGVVADVKETTLTSAFEPTRYFLHRQETWFSPQVSIVIKTSRGNDAAAVLESARRAIQAAAPDVAIQGVTTMENVLDAAVGPARQVMRLLTLVAWLAVTLGAVGIYGVISHFASRRKRDWAIRVALGLPGSGVVRHVVGQGISLALIGIAAGAVGAAAMTSLLKTFLYGVGAIDPIAFGAASLALLVIGGVAAFLPAWRAGRVDPALVLREE